MTHNMLNNNYTQQDSNIFTIENNKLEINSSSPLVHKHKMDALGRLTGGLAHDFNNFLTIIKGTLHMAKRSIDKPETALKYLEQLDETINKAADLNRQLLFLSKTQIISLKSIHINELIMEIKSELNKILGETNTLCLDLSLDILPVMGSAEHLKKCLLNLACNSKEAMPQGGRFTIAAENFFYDCCSNDVLLESGHYVHLTITDTGSGISKENLPHIFEPLFTTQKKKNGKGLGLSTVYGIIDKFGGAVTVESELEKGTTFHIYLKAAE